MERLSEVRAQQATREPSPLYRVSVYVQAQKALTDTAIADARRLNLKPAELDALCNLASARNGVHRITPIVRARVRDGKVVHVWRAYPRRAKPRPGRGRVICAFDPNATPTS